MAMPTLAVIVPVHNKRSHLERSFGSILGQRGSVHEIIAVDDASSDGSRAWLETLNDPRFKLVANDGPPLGPGGARNAGIRACRSDWIAFLDADDEWLPDMAEHLRFLIESVAEEAPCVFTSFLNVYADGRREEHVFHELFRSEQPRSLDLLEYVNAWLTCQRSPILMGSMALRRSVLEKIGLFPEGPNARRGEDLSMWLRLAAAGPATYVSRLGVLYHRDSDNMVTKTVSTRVRPIVLTDIDRLSRERTGAERRALHRLNNFVVYDYARISSRSATLGLEPFRHVRFSAGFGWLLRLALLALIPRRLLSRARSIVRPA
jgi:glycosyltransferase involved in cell wall biosynthesis